MPENKNDTALELIERRMQAIGQQAMINAGHFTPEQREEFDSLKSSRDALLEAGAGSGSGVAILHPRKVGPASPHPPKSKGPANSPKMESLFPGVRTDDGGFESVSDFVTAVHFGDSARLAISGQNSVADPEGGFLVPSAFAWEQLNASLESEVVRPRCRNVGMPSPTFTLSDWADYSHAEGKIDSGLEGQWLVEGGEMSYSVSKTEQLKLVAHKLAMLTSATNEMILDAPGFEGRFEDRMRKAISWNLYRSMLIKGTGVGSPESVLNSPSLITVAKESGQPAATVVWQNLTKMFARLHPTCISNAVWVCSSTLIPQLLEMTITVGTGGSVIPAMTGGAGNYSLLTRPVIFTEKCNALGTAGDIMLVDFSQYICGMLPAGGMRFDKSMHVKFLTDETVFRLIMRVEGKSPWRTAFTPVNGDTQSWAVALATRS